jgi:hypothetical protein
VNEIGTRNITKMIERESKFQQQAKEAGKDFDSGKYK